MPVICWFALCCCARIIFFFFVNCQISEISEDDIEFLRYMREISPFLITIFQGFARNPSDATSTVATEDSKAEEVAIDGLTPKQARDGAKAWAGQPFEIPLTKNQVRRDAQKAKLKVSDKEIESALSKKDKYLMVAKGIDEVKLPLTRTIYKLYDQFDGSTYDPTEKQLNYNDDNYITAAHIVPEKAAKNTAIQLALNTGFESKFDFNSKRNIILIKNKYSAALEAHKIGIAWSQKRGYYIQVRENCMQEFGHLHDEPLLFFEGCNRTKNPQFPPYRRAIAYSYLALMQRVGTIYEEMRKISLGGDD